MNLKSLGVIIAQREYSRASGGSVEALIGKPEIFPDGEGVDGYFYCPFQIKGLGNDKIMYGVGIDSVDSILGAIRMLGAIFNSSSTVSKGDLKWIGDTASTGDLGFPPQEFWKFQQTDEG